MSIPDAVWKYAKELGLTRITTGDGDEYVCREFGANTIMVLDNTNVDSSPENLDEECHAALCLNSEQTDGILIYFESARAAIEFMAHDFSLFPMIRGE